MSFDPKNKENSNCKYCFECVSKSNVEHICSSQLLSDSNYTLEELAHQQLKQIEQFSLESNYLTCQQQLRTWHQSAVQHLQQIYEQHRTNLDSIYQSQLKNDLNLYRNQLIEQIRKKILPKTNQFIDKQQFSMKKSQQISSILKQIESEYEILKSYKWIDVHLPDVKNFSVPIRIAKMALAAKLTDGEKDPVDELSDDDDQKQAKNNNNNKSIECQQMNLIDLIGIFANNPQPFASHCLQTNSSTLAFSQQQILVHDNKQLILFDLNKKLNVFPWNDNDYGILVDICWMNSINRFLILTIHSLYQYDPTSSFNIHSSKIDNIQLIDRSHVFASICSFDRSLFLNYHKGIHIDQYDFDQSNQFQFVKRFSKNELCESKDLGIRDIRSNNQHICLSIMQSEDLKWRLDLMSRDMIRVRKGVPMDAGENQHKFFSMLIPIGSQAWLFVNWFTNKLWIVDQQGKTRFIKENNIKNIRNLALSIQQNYLAIRLEKPSLLNIYKLN